MSTILIVDDVPANRDVLVTLLAHEGHTLIEAADGDEGLRLARSCRPDLVISDVLMPVMDGYEFVRQLRLDVEIAATPVVFYTAHYGERDARVLALASGVSDVLTKPVELDEVLRVVSRVLSLRPASGLLDPPRLTTTFDRDHLRLVTDKLSEKAGDLKASNSRLRALINIGLELASERDASRLLQRVCLAVWDLFGAASVTLGVVDSATLTLQEVVSAGAGDAPHWIKAGDVVSGILRTVVVERRTVRGDNASGDPAGIPFLSRQAARQPFLAAPIASPTAVYGWICLAGDARRIFTDDDDDLIVALSGLVGRIYENGHLIDVAQQRTEALQREIIERHQIEDALRASERLNRNLVDHLPHRILVKNPDSTVLFCNANYASDLGLSAADVIGRSAAASDPAPLSNVCTADDLAVISTGLTRDLEEPYEVAGQKRWRHTVKLPYRDEQGSIIGVLVLFEDITDRRTLEAQFQQAQKMEAVGCLAAGVAHDFNNLLTLILGLCELVLADPDLEDGPRSDIREIQTVGASAAGLTRQLLAFSRKQIIEPTVFDLNLVLTEMQAMLDRVTREDVTVVMKLHTAPISVRADRGQIEQIVMNLAVNASDAMPDGGTLTVESAQVELDADYAGTHAGVVAGPYAALTVSDTGMGIAPEIQARLFEPFFTTKDAGKGTGLGLASVQGIAARSGGSVSVSSEVGHGACFTVYLPSADANAIIAEPSPIDGSSRAGSASVLVVDDSLGIRELARRLLERDGYSVLTAENGEAALQVFDQHADIDILLTDVVMPGGNGTELTKQLLEDHPTLKVVYMSGYTEDAIAQQGVLNPGIAFVHKPFTSETLGRKIRQAAQQEAAQPADALRAD